MTAYDPVATLTDLLGRQGAHKPSKVHLKDGTSFLGTPVSLSRGGKGPDSVMFAVHASANVMTVLVREIRSIT